MAAQELNVADLRSLLQMKLHQQGDTLDPDGYEYVSVQEGSSDYAEMRSQDPLEEEDEGDEINPKTLQDDSKLVPSQPPEPLMSQTLSVAELRAMLEAAVQHAERNSAGECSQNLNRVIRTDESQDLLATVAGPSKRQRASNTCSFGMQSSKESTRQAMSQYVSKTSGLNSVMVETVQSYSEGQRYASQVVLPKDNKDLFEPLRKVVSGSNSQYVPKNTESLPRQVVVENDHPCCDMLPKDSQDLLDIESQLENADDTQGLVGIPKETPHEVTQRFSKNDCASNDHSLEMRPPPLLMANSQYVSNEPNITTVHMEILKTDVETGGAGNITVGIDQLSDSQEILDFENMTQYDCPQGTKDRSPLAARDENQLNSSIHDLSGQGAALGSTDNDVPNWEAKYKQLEKQYKELSEKHKKCKQKFAKLEADKLTADDYSLRLGKEMMQLKDKQMIKTAHFTEEEGIPVTVADLEELNSRADTDSLFVGLLATRAIGAEKLAKMSVTGQACHRFSKAKYPDGTPRYPAAEGIDPKIIEFLCNKVAERTAIKIGPENLATIRKRSELAVVKKYVGQKIANLKKAAEVRNARTQDSGNIRL